MRCNIETDRTRFLGRGNEIRDANAVMLGLPLSNTTGTVLDPIFSLRHRVRIRPGTTTRVAYWTLSGRLAQEALDLVDKHHDPAAFERALTMAWTQAQVQLHHLGIDPMRPISSSVSPSNVLYSDPRLRPSPELTRARPRPSPRASLGPRNFRRSSDRAGAHRRGRGTQTVRSTCCARSNTGAKRLAIDIVIHNEGAHSYVQDLQVSLEALARAARRRRTAEPGRGAVFVVRADLSQSRARGVLLAGAASCSWSRRGARRAGGRLPEREPNTLRAEPTAAPREAPDATPHRRANSSSGTASVASLTTAANT